jgi:phosphatidylglycerophosphate synthase
MSHPIIFASLYFFSYSLDFVDGLVARMFNQSS